MFQKGPDEGYMAAKADVLAKLPHAKLNLSANSKISLTPERPRPMPARLLRFITQRRPRHKPRKAVRQWTLKKDDSNFWRD